MILNAWLLGAGVVLATCHSQELERFESVQPHMGTRFIIVLYAPNEKVANQGFQAAFDRIAELDDKLNDYRRQSELSRLSRSAPAPHPIGVSDDLFQVLSAARKLSDATGGAFDVTVGPLTKLWRRAHRRREMPDPRRLERALAATDYRAMRLDPAQREVRLTQPNMRLDLGGIAKGYAADQALRELECGGIDRALVNASGDMAASGPPPDSPGWLVGVTPLGPTNDSVSTPQLFGHLAHQAIATSGDTYQFVEIEGQRYSHIVDPRTGLGLTKRIGVSVLAPTGMQADSLASAVSVLGVHAGLDLISRRSGVEAMIVEQKDDQKTVKQTPGFRRWATARVDN